MNLIYNWVSSFPCIHSHTHKHTYICECTPKKMETQINGIAERKIRSHSWQRHTWQKLLKYKIRVHILHVFALKIHSHTRTYVVYIRCCVHMWSCKQLPCDALKQKQQLIKVFARINIRKHILRSIYDLNWVCIAKRCWKMQCNFWL